MEERVREVRRIIRFNRRTLFAFEILYKLLGVTVFVPLLFRVFDLLLSFTGYHYLTLENIRRFLMHPMVYVGFLFLVLLVLLYTAGDMSAVIYILHCSNQYKKCTLEKAIRFMFKNLKAMFRKGNRRILLTVLLMIPFFSVVQIPELLASYSIPSIVQVAMRQRILIVAGVILLFLLLTIPFLRQLYAVHYFTLDNLDSANAKKKSRKLGNYRHRWDLLTYLLVQLGTYLLYMLFLLLVIFIVVLIGRLTARVYLVSAFTTSVIRMTMTVLLLVFNLAGTPICCTMISMLYYRRKNQRGEALVSVHDVDKARRCIPTTWEKAFRVRHKKLIVLGWSGLFLVTVVACVVYILQAHRGEFRRNVEYMSAMEVTAHRGASRYYPENTMSAFQGAIEAGTDWIELDVQQSRDGQIFVMHDRNFKRTTGVNAYSWDMDYEEIAKLDAGSSFNKKFEGEHIPLLTEVIALAKENHVRLNIEIKPAPKDVGLEEHLVQILEEEDFLDSCVMTSQAYRSIEKVKELDPDIVTVYVTGFAYGRITGMPAADNFSIRSSSVSPAIVRRVHNAGKQIYAWTVNSRDMINLMIDRQVDNIITDDVPLAKKCIDRKITSDTVSDLVAYLNRQLRFMSYRL